MTLRRLALLALGASALAGCASKPLVVDCAKFRSDYTFDLPNTAVVDAIQDDAKGGLPPEGPDGVVRRPTFDPAALDAFLSSQLAPALNTASLNEQDTAPPPAPVLLLSGGGQWGAFGAGYLAALQRKRPDALPRVQLITGVSTGALQALFLAANQTAAAQGKDVMGALTRAYTITREDEVVHRRGYLGAVTKGSLANLEPLRARIENALCPPTDSGRFECPVLDYLGQKDAPVVLLGLVEAESGKMVIANITRIARELASDPADEANLRRAQQCVTGAALASVAMPFYYQQVQVRSTPTSGGADQAITYLDGGVRQSVFFTFPLDALKRATGGSAPIYVLRNGPTVALGEPDANQPRNAIEAAQRGYSLLVNQSEVASIERIRLAHPAAPMRVATADGHDRAFTDPGLPGTAPAQRQCRKAASDAMFEPAFMACLQGLGRKKAAMDAADGRPDGWIDLP